MAATLSNFKSALNYGGARPSLFDIEITRSTGLTALTGVSGVTNIVSHCNVSAIPPLTVTPIEKQYFGRTVKIPGDIVFGDLSTTILNTEDYSIRNAIETWMDHINSHADNVTSDNFADDDFRATIELSQYGKDGAVIQTYKFFDAWPMTLTEIALSYDTASDLEQYDVTWAYNYYSHTSDEYDWDLT
jgi:hypothetical protein